MLLYKLMYISCGDLTQWMNLNELLQSLQVSNGVEIGKQMMPLFSTNSD